MHMQEREKEKGGGGVGGAEWMPSADLHVGFDLTTLSSWPEPKSRVWINQMSHPGPPKYMAAY